MPNQAPFSNTPPIFPPNPSTDATPLITTPTPQPISSSNLESDPRTTQSQQNFSVTCSSLNCLGYTTAGIPTTMDLLRLAIVFYWMAGKG